MQTHVKVLAVIMLIFVGIGVLVALGFMMLFGGTAAVAGMSGEEDAAIGAGILGLTGTALTVIMLIFSLPAVIAGWGLLKFKSWARILGIGVSALSLINIPIGTIVGAYGLWVLLNAETQRMFEGPGAGSHPTTV